MTTYVEIQRGIVRTTRITTTCDHCGATRRAVITEVTGLSSVVTFSGSDRLFRRIGDGPSTAWYCSDGCQIAAALGAAEARRDD